LEQRSLSFVPGDTGLGGIILRGPDGTLDSAVIPASRLDAAAALLNY
jgi:hypothetical protein